MATLVVLDASFATTTTTPGWPFVVSLLLALVVELTLAGLSLGIAGIPALRAEPPAR